MEREIHCKGRRERVLEARREARVDVGLEPTAPPAFLGGQGRTAEEVEDLGALALIVIAALVAGGVLGLLLYCGGKAVGA